MEFPPTDGDRISAPVVTDLPDFLKAPELEYPLGTTKPHHLVRLPFFGGALVWKLSGVDGSKAQLSSLIVPVEWEACVAHEFPCGKLGWLLSLKDGFDDVGCQ